MKQATKSFWPLNAKIDSLIPSSLCPKNRCCSLHNILLNKMLPNTVSEVSRALLMLMLGMLELWWGDVELEVEALHGPAYARKPKQYKLFIARMVNQK